MHNQLPSPTSTKSNSNPTNKGFSDLAIRRIQEGQRANQISLVLIYIALFCLLGFGTLASIDDFRQNQTVYLLFNTFPYILIGLGIPCQLYTAFILWRYRLSQPSLLMLFLSLAGGLSVIGFFISGFSWLAMTAWIALAFVFKANLKRFFRFLSNS